MGDAQLKEYATLFNVGYCWIQCWMHLTGLFFPIFFISDEFGGITTSKVVVSKLLTMCSISD